MSLDNEFPVGQTGKVAHNLEKAWRITDVAALSRGDWRRLSFGLNRVVTQEALLGLAEGEKPATQSERLSLYQAAYAVLPLHGDSLDALARLLVESGLTPLEWADVLVESLAQTPQGESHAATVLAALRQTLARTAQGPSSSLERRRAYILASQITGLGYRTAWAADLMAALAPHPPGRSPAVGQANGKRPYSERQASIL